ncbi:MAG: hypothetical protein JXA13_04410 [Anaerolineales bacterium]|nr:hypothetical protein [Anaerolineales bacterium]
MEKIRFLAAGLVLLVSLSCALPSTTLSNVPTPIRAEELGTIIVQTANAAATLTATYAPSATPVFTETPLPSATPSPTPSPTETIVFLLDTLTPVLPSTNTPVMSPDEYACETLSKNPADGAIISLGQSFNWVWIVRNIGTERWEANSTDVLYYKGDKLHTVKGIDLPKDVSSGETVSLVIPMQAPEKTGNQSATWGIKIGNQSVCQTTMSIKVK